MESGLVVFHPFVIYWFNSRYHSHVYSKISFGASNIKTLTRLNVTHETIT